MRKIGCLEIFILGALVLFIMAVLFPWPHGSHEKARTNACLNNQRQISVAIQQYRDDNSSTYFPAPKSGSWSQALAPYIEDKFFDCLTTSERRGNVLHPDYGFNALLLGKPAATLTDPEATLVLADYQPKDIPDSHLFTATDLKAPDYYGTVLDSRHNHGIVCAFADGHIEYITLQREETIEKALARIGSLGKKPILKP
jgi:prepilin-type processing-associated H-X9-DG protein